ncbi:tRNA-specific adenosine deaminase 1 [Liparis tanakae]|uniref:tRNA-specific adenosine deaminase 1 n=1 Tax=Liparis tanakae TaxID=230148 RepID=A0A4Z2F5T8_9TELE|nr:tRNA-specific adenosine deaminase 1 [Liparis tanakae]
MVHADEIANLCYERFRQLPRRGKPEPGREWTLLAAVVQLTRRAPSDSGQRKWSLRPGVSFLFFTSHTPCGDAAIIPMSDGRSKPRPPVTPVKSHGGTEGRGGLKRGAEEPGGADHSKQPRLEDQDQEDQDQDQDQDQEDQDQEDQDQEDQDQEDQDQEDQGVEAGGDVEQSLLSDSLKSDDPSPDVHRTGAKCVPGGPADARRPGAGYHSTGALRVKPGRGEPTRSLSCSDKLARWGVLGFQGALLAHYLQGALYFSVVVVGRCAYSQDAMRRALVSRCSRVADLPEGFSVRPPELLRSSLEFPFSRAQTELRHQGGRGRVSPCGAAISWCHVAERPLDVTANGLKHGVTKKTSGTAAARSLLCKLELFHSFLSLVAATDPGALPDSLRGTELTTYWDFKQASRCYQQAWQQLRRQAFPLWPQADRELLLFH